MADVKTFWPRLYAGTYIAIGSLAFFLPTQDLAEIVARLLLISFGVLLLIFRKDSRACVYILIGGSSFIVLWLGTAVGLIASNFNSPMHRIHLFYLPFWAFFLVKHYKAIKELNG